MHISAISVHQLALLSRFPVNWRGRYSMAFVGFFATRVGCLRSVAAPPPPPPPPPAHGGCGLLATSSHHSGLGHSGGPLAGWAGLVAGLQVGQAFGVFLLLGLGVGGSNPQVPRHPTSMCESGIKY